MTKNKINSGKIEMDNVHLREGEKVISRTEEYDMNFGTNIIRNCSGAVTYRENNGEEKELFILQKSGDDLLLTTEVRNEKGQLLTKIIKNEFRGTKSELMTEKFFEIDKSVPKELILRNNKNKIIFKARIVDNKNIHIVGIFFINGLKIEASDDKLMIGTNTVSGNEIIGFGYGILIEDGGFVLYVVKSDSWGLNDIDKYIDNL